MKSIAICAVVSCLSFCSQASGQTGIIMTVAGKGTPGFSGDGGPAASASLNLSSPSGGSNLAEVAVDAFGNLFIADTNNNRVRKVSSGGIITTVAGNGTSGSSGDDGPATSAQLSGPTGIAVDASGNLFIADIYNSAILKVSASGIITTVAGNGINGFSGDGGPAVSASLWGPHSVAVDTSGNLFIADSPNNRIRKVSAGGIITTVAGNGNEGFSGDGGQAISASLDNPTGVAVDASGNLYIADWRNNRIRKVSAGGIITTVAGNGNVAFSGDGDPATSTSLDGPSGVAVDASGNLFIADSGSNRIRKVSASGIITTVAGNGNGSFSGDGGPATTASLNDPTDVAVDASGNLFIADTGNNVIREVSASAIADVIENLVFSGTVTCNESFDSVCNSFGTGHITGSYSLDITAQAIVGAWSFSTPFGAISSSAPGASAYVASAAGNIAAVFEINTSTVLEFVEFTFPDSDMQEIGAVVPGSHACINIPGGEQGETACDPNTAITGTAALAVTAATAIFSVTPAALYFQIPQGAQAQSQSLQIGGTAGTAWQAMAKTSTGGGWLSVSPGTGQIPASLAALVNAIGLTAGTYQGSITIQAPGATPSSSTINVMLTVTAASDTIETLNFTGTVTCYVETCGSFSSGPLTGTYSLDVTTQTIVGAWSFSTPFGVISSSHAGAYAQLVTSAGYIGAQFGEETATPPFFESVLLYYPGTDPQETGAVGPSYACSPVTGMEACYPANAVSGATKLAAAAISATNVASFTTSIAPGSLVALFGNGNILANSTASGFSTPLPTSSGGTSVTMNGILCPLVYVSPTQINLQAPTALSAGTATVMVNNNGTTFSTTAQVLAAAPGIFTSDYMVTAILQDGNGAVLNQNNPASPGQTVAMYLTGIGPVTNYPGDGEPAPFGPLAQSNSSYTLTVNGNAAHIDYLGLTPGLVGVGQINFEIPAGTPSGNTIPVVLTIAGTASKTVQISVKATASMPQIQSLTLSPNSVASGGTVTGTVMLSPAAPSGGAVVALSSSSSGASAPASVTVPAGATSATFTVSAGTVSSNLTITITASYGGRSAQASLTVGPPPNSQCTNVSGNWNASESGSITETIAATVETDTETNPISGTGSVTISQTGCSIQYDPIGESGLIGTNLTPSQLASLIRTGTVSGSNVSITGILALVDTVASAQAGFTVANISSNLLTGSGQVAGNVMTLNETGMFVASGTYSISGQTGSFTETITTSTTATFNWASGVRPADETLPRLTSNAGSTRSVEIRVVPDRVGSPPAGQGNIPALLRAALRKAIVLVDR